MRTKGFRWLAVGFALLFSANAGYADTLAFDFTLSGNQGWTGRLGNYFNVVSSPITVTALGVFDNPPVGFAGPIEVGIFNTAGSGTLLFSATIGPGAPGWLVNNTRFVDIPDQVLVAGSYAVVAVGFDNVDKNYNTNIAPKTPVTVNTGGGLIAIPSPSGLYDGKTTLGTDLTGVTKGNWTFGGGSFMFVPEPSGLLLLGAGLLGAGIRLRRKR